MNADDVWCQYDMQRTMIYPTVHDAWHYGAQLMSPGITYFDLMC